MTILQEIRNQPTTYAQIGSELVSYTHSLGAKLYGVASADDYIREFPGKPSPRSFVKDAQSVILIGLPFEPGTVATVLGPALAGLRAKASDQVSHIERATGRS